MLVTSNFSFSHRVFKRFVLQRRKNQGLFGKRLSSLVIATPWIFHEQYPQIYLHVFYILHFPSISGTTLLPSITGTNNLATSFTSTLPITPLTHIPQPMAATHLPHGIAPLATATTAQRPTMLPQIIYWYPTPPVSPQTYYTNTVPSMVVMRGLPFNVSVQDILNFFQGFPEVRPSVQCPPSFLVVAVQFLLRYSKRLRNLFSLSACNKNVAELRIIFFFSLRQEMA